MSKPTRKDSRLKTWLSPYNLTLLLLLALPFERIPSHDIAGITIRPSLVIGGVLILSAIFRYRRRMFEAKGVSGWAILFLFCSFLAALDGLTLKRGLTVFGFYVFVYLVAKSISLVIATEPKLQRLSRWLIAGALLAAALAFYQFFGDLLGISNKLTGLRSDYTKAVLGFPRVQAASLEPLFFANYLLLPFGVSLTKGLTKQRWYLLAALFMTLILMTVSRGGTVAAVVLAFGIAIYAFLMGKTRQILPLAGSVILGFLVSYFLLTTVVNNLKPLHSTKPTTTNTYQQHAVDYAEISQPQSERTETRMVAWDIFKAHPILGVGPGEFGIAALRAGKVTSDTQTVNNLPLEILAETGILGALSFLVFALALAWYGILGIYRAHNIEVRTLGIAGLVFLAGSAIQYQTTSTLYIMQVWVGIGFLLGAIDYAARNANSART